MLVVGFTGCLAEGLRFKAAGNTGLSDLELLPRCMGRLLRAGVQVEVGAIDLSRK